MKSQTLKTGVPSSSYHVYRLMLATSLVFIHYTVHISGFTTTHSTYRIRPLSNPSTLEYQLQSDLVQRNAKNNSNKSEESTHSSTKLFTPPPPFQDTASFNDAIQLLAKKSQYSSAQSAQDLLDELEQWYERQLQLGIHVITTYSALGSNKNSGYVEIPGPVPDAYSYTSVIDAWARVGEFNRAISLLKRMEYIDSSSTNATFPRNIKPNTITYNSVINSLCPQNNYSVGKHPSSSNSTAHERPIMAEALLNQMKEFYNTGSNTFCLPDTTTYNTVIKVWAQSGRKDAGERAEVLLEEMWKIHDSYRDDKNNPANITPDQFSYSSTISAWARSGLGSRAAKRGEELLEIMEQFNKAGYRDLRPTVYCVNSVLNAWAKTKSRGSAQRAETILRRMEDLYENKRRSELCPNTISYNTVISAYAHDSSPGSENRAEYILKHMDRLSSDPLTKDLFSTCIPDTISYNTVINAWSKSRHPMAAERAEAILNHMEDQLAAQKSSVAPDIYTYTSVLNAWAKSKDSSAAERAESLLNRMEISFQNGNNNSKPNAFSYNTVCNAWAKSSHKSAADRAVNILQRMEKLYISGESSIKPDVYTYTSVIDALAKQGTKDAAEQAEELLLSLENEYEMTSDYNIKPNIRTYTTVITAISRSHLSPTRAEHILKRMENKNMEIDVVCFNAVINAYGWSTEPGKAKKVYQLFNHMWDMFQSGKSIHTKPDLITLNSLLNACAFSNQKNDSECAESLEIAVKAFDFVQEFIPDVEPNQMTFGTMLMVFNNLIPSIESREELCKNIFYQCCKSGNLSALVISQLLRGVSLSTLKDLLGPAVVEDDKNGVYVDKNKVPQHWYKSAGEKRSRPASKKTTSKYS